MTPGMTDQRIMKVLTPINEEEQRILDGKKTIDRTLYMEKSEDVINSKNLLEMGKLITIRPHTRFIHFPEHTHDYIEVVYMCSGNTTHLINGTKLVLGEGELLFLNRHARQEIMEAGVNDIAVNFIILPQFFDTALAMLGEEETPIRRFVLDCLTGSSRNETYLHFKVRDVLPIQNLVENLLFTLISNTPNKRQINQSTMGLLLLNLVNHTDKLSCESTEDVAIVKVYRYIEENYRSGTLTEIADMLHYDLYSLSRMIKKKTGKTYKELIQEKRLSQAAFLLLSTAMNISDVSIAVGYENVSYFHRIFAEHFRCSPKMYRENEE